MSDMVIKKEFLKSFIDAIKFEGVSEETAKSVCKTLGLDDRHYHLWFYDGLPEIVKAVEEEMDNRMIQELSSYSHLTRITEKIRQALIVRLYGQGENKLIYQALAKYYLTPRNIPKAASSAWATIDKMWQYAGDESLDWNYYSKRSILFGIYNSALIFYLNETDPDFHKTTEVIDRALAKVIKFGKLKQKFTKIENIPILRLFM